ncbi:vitamin H transporter 1 [Nadsonia fulvescens var. elongata DSM 6958]|uniref:Vitamin H transporter 1 n=1 Tax=Nadsonia fulvescens var. elongata DSM 6958 TaxID=857566 RepID=A0A1E3PKK4_9ASCO|nr:vitamin H transporter 1 [Nadsonia fulvescens var. elongata DSM 6958]
MSGQKYSSDIDDKLQVGSSLQSITPSTEEKYKQPSALVVEQSTEELDEKELDRIYRKLDLRIIPALWCLYFLTSYGSSAYGVSLTMNSETHNSLIARLHLSPHHTSIASALYYVGYIVFDVPFNLIMTRVAPQAWLSRIVMTVGLVYGCYAALSSADGVIAIRFISGMCGAGTWPGMAYYVSLWYPPHRTARRIGYYFTAAQVSAAVSGLISAGFQKMDGQHGLAGFQWMFLIYGIITFFVGISLLWWLPDRPFKLEEQAPTSKIGIFFEKFAFAQSPILTPEESALHKKDMQQRYVKVTWGLSDLWNVLIDVRIIFLVLMYFGVVGTGNGIVVAGTTIIKAAVPKLSSISLSLLFAPIWICDLISILIFTPFSDKFKNHRGLAFSLSTVVIIVGIIVNTFAHAPWARYVGLLICGFGLGPTVPIVMTWTAEIFGPRHGDVGTAASAALVSGLGNLGSVTTTYALYKGWNGDAARKFLGSNMVIVGILVVSIISSFGLELLRRVLGDLKRSNASTV